MNAKNNITMSLKFWGQNDFEPIILYTDKQSIMHEDKDIFRHGGDLEILPSTDSFWKSIWNCALEGGKKRRILEIRGPAPNIKLDPKFQ